MRSNGVEVFVYEAFHRAAESVQRATQMVERFLLAIRGAMFARYVVAVVVVIVGISQRVQAEEALEPVVFVYGLVEFELVELLHAHLLVVGVRLAHGAFVLAIEEREECVATSGHE